MTTQATVATGARDASASTAYRLLWLAVFFDLLAFGIDLWARIP